MGWLLDALALLGLQVNESKTKLLTTEPGYFKEGLESILQINGAYVHLLGCHEWHRYLGQNHTSKGSGGGLGNYIPWIQLDGRN